MEHRRITCPETGGLVEIELERTPYGSLIKTCSRFDGGCAVRCSGGCARRADIDEPPTIADRSERVLIVYANAQYTLSIAQQLATLLTLDGLTVELADADSGSPPPPEDYEAVVIGTSPRFWRPPRSLVRYITRNRKSLAGMATLLFSVGDAPAKDLGLLAERSQWLPSRTFVFPRPDVLGLPHHEELRAFASAVADAVPPVLLAA